MTNDAETMTNDADTTRKTADAVGDPRRKVATSDPRQKVTTSDPRRTPATGDFLAGMMAEARERTGREREARPLQRPRARRQGPSLLEALRAPRGGGLGVIAEVKRASPSKGALAPGLDAAAQARAYDAAGADAVSVLTEPDWFRGSLDDLAAVTAAVGLPVVRKDFIVSEYQLWQAVAAGASAVLLIAAGLTSHELVWLHDEALDLGLDALVEVHDERDVAIANDLRAPIVGINNRDLRTLAVDLLTTRRLAPLVHRDAVIVSESGVGDAADAALVRAAGADAVLVGEALVRAGDAGAVARRLAAIKHGGGPRPEGAKP